MYNKLCTRINLKSTAAPNGYYPITKCNTNTSPITRIDHNGDVYDFGRIADDESGVLNYSLYQKLVALKLQGNSTQAASSVPKYTCQGKSVAYKFVDYIESSGTQYIDTGVKLNQSSRVQLKYQYVGTPSSARVFGDATDPNRGWMITTQNGSISTKIQTLYGDDWRPTQSDPESAIPNNDIVEYERNGANQYVNGELYYTNNASTFQTSDTAKIFGAYYLNMALSSVRVYGCKIWNDGTLVRDFVPAYDGNGTIGLFDKVNEKFYTNAGTGTFSKGTDTSDGAISSISSITLGGQTVSVDLRSAGSVYDEWASNSRGTRKCVEQTYDATGWSWNSENSCYVHAKPAGAIANQTNFLLSDTRYTIAAYELVGQTDFAFLGYSNINIRDSRYSGTTDLAAFSEYISGLTIVVALTSGNYQAITSTPLTLASGLTPTDQDGNAVTFTESTESTPSPNYPVSIVNCIEFSINTATEQSVSLDLAGLTNKDELYVNVESTNIWDEITELGNIDYTTGENGTSTTQLRSKNYIPVEAQTAYYLALNGSDNIRLFAYDSDKVYIGSLKDDDSWTPSSGQSDSPNNASFTTPAGCAFIRFFTTSSYGTTYNHDISISLGSTVVDYMPHDTIGKVWKKQQVGGIDLGSITYTYDSGNKRFLGTVAGATWGEQRQKLALCPIYECKHNGEPFNINWNYVFYIGSNLVVIHDHGYTNPTTFANALSGVPMYYPLSSPIWTDITSTSTGAALLAMETYQADSLTISIDNSGTAMAKYWRQA